MTRAQDVDTLGEDGYRRLPGAAQRVWQTENAAGALLATVVVVVLVRAPFTPAAWDRWLLPVLVVIAGITAVEALVVIPRRFRFYRYAPLEDGIVVRQGKILFRQLTVPAHQVLYLETRQGPFLRHVGLYSVHIGTIGEPHAVGPLSEDAVTELRRAVRPLVDLP